MMPRILSRMWALGVFLGLCGAGLTAQQTDPWAGFLERACSQHGAPGEAAARFLLEHRPAQDAGLEQGLLLVNLELALRARKEFPWAKELPLELFHNDVLPYAVLDETREQWRPALYALARELVQGCSTASEAAQALNRQLYRATGVQYNTGRKRANQSPFESMASGRASCTGLSILLVDACRAVGIAARVAGVAQWNGKAGNHTWVEIWDDGWHFTGAAEYDAKGLDRGWFQGDASRALAGVERHAVWASSWAATGARFPMVWAPDSHAVAGVDVTGRYAPEPLAPEKQALRNLRLWNRRDGRRLALQVELLDAGGARLAEVTTGAGTQDLNDMPQLSLEPDVSYRLRVRRGQRVRTLELPPQAAGTETLELYWDELPLDQMQAEALRSSLYTERVAELGAERVEELEQETFVLGDKRLRILERSFGEEPADGHSLWISMHGGGGAASEVNDGQWRNQIRLYDLEEGIYVAPRAPTDSWNMWHQAHIDGLFARLIDSYVALRGVNPNRVYLLGYSAGGDGVYQLAPRMADRFAAACMMAGHPNEARPLGLRNLPFGIFMGGQDSAYDRNTVAERWAGELGALRQADPEGYPHRYDSYPECGHWMDGQDAEGLPWMAGMTRNPWPKRVVWYQDDVLHESSYWLQVPAGQARKGQLVEAEVDGQRIRISSEGLAGIVLRLRDELVDLDQELQVFVGEQLVFQGVVPRTERAIRDSLLARCDQAWAASALLELSW